MDINSKFNESLLALAVYADGLDPGMTDSQLKEALIDNESGASGMTAAQAEYIAGGYRVIVQQSTTSSGFSATLFQNLNTDEYHLAMRGTDGQGPDWRDANLNNFLSSASRNQIVDMVNFYLRLTQSGAVNQYAIEEVRSLIPPSDPHYMVDPGVGPNPIPTYAVLVVEETATGLGKINESEALMISGHSLGGHLASAFTLLFSSVAQETHTFNSAGFIAGLGHEFTDLAALLSASVTDLEITPTEIASNVTDISAPLDFVSSLSPLGQQHLGEQVEVQVESVSFLNIPENHSMDRLTDAFAVINFMAQLDEAFTIDMANEIFLSASDEMNASWESLANHFARLFGREDVPLDDAQDGIYALIYDTENGILADIEVGSYQISIPDGDIVQQAASGDQAALYTLLNLAPFVLRGAESSVNEALYSPHNLNGELDAENYSAEFLSDRALMLNAIIQRNEADTKHPDRIDGDAILFNDAGIGTVFAGANAAGQGGTNTLSADDVTNIVFGNNQDDGLLIGHDNNDRFEGAFHYPWNREAA